MVNVAGAKKLIPCLLHPIVFFLRLADMTNNLLDHALLQYVMEFDYPG